MFTVIINFPAIKEGQDAAFREWFDRSNKEFVNHKGFIQRLLLKPAQGGGNYVAIVVHESRETFMAMHTSPAHEEAGRRVASLLDGHPTPQFYEVVIKG
jgi:heme-degrading monooxygenase HmoA